MKKKTQRQEEAKERQKLHDSLTLEQKIKKAKSRRGNSKKEIEKLENQLKEKKNGN